MNAKLLKLGLGAVFLISLASLGAILLFINPYKTGWTGWAMFSVVVAMLAFSLFSWLGFRLRRRYIDERSADRVLKMVFRQGVLAAVVAAGGLWLSHFRFFKLYTVLALAVFVFGTEYYLARRQTRHQSTNTHE